MFEEESEAADGHRDAPSCGCLIWWLLGDSGCHPGDVQVDDFSSRANSLTMTGWLRILYVKAHWQEFHMAW